jgi:hypothetical protein
VPKVSTFIAAAVIDPPREKRLEIREILQLLGFRIGQELLDQSLHGQAGEILARLALLALLAQLRFESAGPFFGRGLRRK